MLIWRDIARLYSAKCTRKGIKVGKIHHYVPERVLMVFLPYFLPLLRALFLEAASITSLPALVCEASKPSPLP